MRPRRTRTADLWFRRRALAVFFCVEDQSGRQAVQALPPKRERLGRAVQSTAGIDEVCRRLPGQRRSAVAEPVLPLKRKAATWQHRLCANEESFSKQTTGTLRLSKTIVEDKLFRTDYSRSDRQTLGRRMRKYCAT